MTLLFFFNTGNVGINNISPNYKLDVNGDINMSSNNTFRIGASQILKYNSTNKNLVIGTSKSTLTIGEYTLPAKDGKPNQVLKTNGAGILSWQNDSDIIYKAGTGLDLNENIFTNAAPDKIVKINGGTGITITGSYPNFTIGSTITSSQWSANAQQDIYYNGKVGIGTNNPSAQLEVYGGDAMINGLTVGQGPGDESQSNTVVGNGALYNNANGYGNTAIGNATLGYNTSGFNNTASGYGALSTNTTGNSNSAYGVGALGYNDIGYWNTATGYYSLYYNLAHGNTADGYFASYTNNFANYNTAIGFQALYFNSGDYNTALGYNADINPTTTSYNNTTVIGNSALGTASNQVRIGNSM